MAEGGAGVATARGAAVQCSPEEEAENAEQQETELDMLQSIFEGQILVLNSSQEYLIRVIPRVNSKLLLVPGTPPADKNQPNATTPPLTEVTHLPEVTVYVKCPPTYPSLLPPDCHLSARWMDSKLTPALLSHLRDMFTPGCLVVYEWVMYLQDELVQDYCEHSARSSRERVCYDGKLQIPQCSTEEPRPPHSTPEDPHPPRTTEPCPPNCLFLRSTSLIHDINEYDKFEQFQEFQAEQHECGVCFRQFSGVDMCQPCEGCGLLYCRECLCDYCKSCIGDKRIVSLECPDSKCHQVLPDIYLKKLLPQEFFKRYVEMREKIELDSIPGMVFCPRCKNRTLSDPSSNAVMCDNTECGFPFCKICQQTWHGPGPCPALDKVSALNKEDGASGEATRSEDTPANKQRRLEELQSVLWMLSSKSVLPCPNCRTQIQKNGGCNKMACYTCGSSFCWMCGKSISGYDHFDRGDRSNKCVLFRDEDYLPPAQERDIEGVDTIEEIESVMQTKCPRCNKIEVKSSDDNWMKCYRCSFQYCHMCGEPCFGRYHFSKYGCTRYSSLKEDIKMKQRLEESSSAESAGED